MPDGPDALPEGLVERCAALLDETVSRWVLSPKADDPQGNAAQSEWLARAVLAVAAPALREQALRETRHKALEVAKGEDGRDRRKCGHEDLHLFEVPDPCMSCAIELGRREGGCEAGLYYTMDEVFGELRAKYREQEP